MCANSLTTWFRRANAHLAGVAFLIVSATSSAQVGRLNDTGVTLCANETSNSVPCGYADADIYGYPRQDSEYGRAPRDAASQLSGKTGSSDASVKGYDFSKMINDGSINQSGVFGTDLTGWICTRDNVTGLVWLLPQGSANNFRKNTNLYAWYNTDSLTNGNSSGNQADVPATTACTNDQGTAVVCCYDGARCDTAAMEAYADGSTSVCGEGSTNSWRLPTRLELFSLLDASKLGTGVAAVDPTYFPSIMNARYWTAETVSGNPAQARAVHLGSGLDTAVPKTAKLNVILVRKP